MRTLIHGARHALRAMACRKWCALALAAVIAGCGGGGGADPAPANVGLVSTSSDNGLRDLGRLIFHDTTLSVSGKMGCVTCHDPAFGHASDPALGAAVAGGPNLNVPGKRNSPTIGYLFAASSLNLNMGENEISGGFNWDGSGNSLNEQALRPFVMPHEMGPQSPADLAAKLRTRPYAPDLRRLYDATVLDDGDRALQAAAAAVAEFLRTDKSFAPFDSKFDAVTDGKASFTPAEMRGFALFVDPNKGNCAFCHLVSPTSASAGAGPRAMFTDFGYDNLGVPRNPAIADNANPTFFDLGLCQHVLAQTQDMRSLCGAFKAPTLRNVAKTAPYFHNGRFATLKEVVEFYVLRDLMPERWYPKRPDGSVNRYDDVPDVYKGNVNQTNGPYHRTPAQGPALTDEEIDDVVTFLHTLSDGWKPPTAWAPASAR